MVRAWIARRVIGRVYAGLARGDGSAAWGAFARDGRLQFPGSHSWAIDTTDAAARRSWFERFARMRPNLTINDVLVAGPPWRTRICIVFGDEIRDPTGAVVYRNQGVQYACLRWGRMSFDQIYLDTQKVAELDRRGLEVGDGS